VFNEKKIDMNWNQSVYYSFSKVFYPSDFEDEKKFIEKIKD
jgi:outer membrane receptor for ferric coprogen and ferric-rhodotorulic acid